MANSAPLGIGTYAVSPRHTVTENVGVPPDVAAPSADTAVTANAMESKPLHFFTIIAIFDILSLWGRASSATAANRYTPALYNNKRNPRTHNSKESEDF